MINKDILQNLKDCSCNPLLPQNLSQDKKYPIKRSNEKID